MAEFCRFSAVNRLIYGLKSYFEHFICTGFDIDRGIMR